MYRVYLSIFLAMAVLTLTVPASTGRNLIKSYAVENTVYQLCARADALMSAGKFAEARNELVQAASYDPTSYSANVHLDLGKCYMQMKKIDAAANEMKKALAFDPSRDDALYNIGSMYFDNKQYDKAVEYLNKYVAATRDQQSKVHAQKFIRQIAAFSYLDKADTAIDRHKYEQAKKLLYTAATYDPSPYSGSVHASLCYVLDQLGQPELAIIEGKKALQIDPTDQHTMYTLGVAYADACKFDEAISWIEKCAARESEPVRRQQYSSCAKGFAEDRQQFNDPNNKQADYLAVMKGDEKPLQWSKARLPLKVAVLPGNGVKGYRASYPNIVKGALDTWCKASGNKLDYRIIKDEKDADIKIIWTTEALKCNATHENVSPCGVTSFDCLSEGILNRATIKIRTVDPFHPENDEEEAECAHTILHELGHALGLGHSKCIRDVMYFRSSSQQNGMSVRDQATLARLYAGYPAIAFAPKAAPTSTATVYSPPPAFIPPEPPDTTKLPPPMFLPPPLADAGDKLTPPMFTPPPINPSPSGKTSSPTAPPMFTPPPIKDNKPVGGKPVDKKPAKKADPASSLFFTPPPVK